MKIIKDALTFDDVLLIPKVSKVNSRWQVDTSTYLTDKIKLNIPLVSSNMDTVTEHIMAIALAKAGGAGIIHRFNSIENEVSEIIKVKREQNIVIEKPYVIGKETSIGKLREMSLEKKVSSFPVLDREKLVGIITRRDFEFEEDMNKKVEDLMTKDVITSHKGISLEEAKGIMRKNKIEKLPLVDREGRLTGMITSRDVKLLDGYSKASKDKNGRLVVGGSIGIGSDHLERAKALIDAEADFIVVDVANGYLEKTADVVREIKKLGAEVIAGNVATKDGVLNLKKAGVDCVKVGIGPGGACLTRPVAGVGYPQLSSIIECAGNDVRIMADGGIIKSADFSKAIAAGADSVMIGGLFAGTDESPGVIITKENINYKFYRGMASVNAFSDRSLKTDEAADLEGYTPEGTETLIQYKGSVVKIVNNLLGGLRSAMTYLNAANLKDFKKNAEFVVLTEAGKRESKYKI
jgi:IMP dehydrogenase